VLMGYRWYDAKNQTPLFPFGFGLSYTSFQYSGARVEHKAGDDATVSVRVTNSGSAPGRRWCSFTWDFRQRPRNRRSS